MPFLRLLSPSTPLKAIYGAVNATLRRRGMTERRLLPLRPSVLYNPIILSALSLPLVSSSQHPVATPSPLFPRAPICCLFSLCSLSFPAVDLDRRSSLPTHHHLSTIDLAVTIVRRRASPTCRTYALHLASKENGTLFRTQGETNFTRTLSTRYERLVWDENQNEQ